MASVPTDSSENDSVFAGEDEDRAMTALVAEFRPALIRYFSRRVGVSHEIPDLVNDVFVRLLQRKDARSIREPRVYVFQTANSVLIDWLRRPDVRRTSVHTSFEPSLHGDSTSGADYGLIQQEELDRVAEVLLELAERTRAIFVLRRIEGMKYKDIAARLGVSLSTVEKEMHKAMIHVSERLGED